MRSLNYDVAYIKNDSSATALPLTLLTTSSMSTFLPRLVDKIRISFLAVLFFFVACESQEDEAGPQYGGLDLPDRPNILWIVAEDLSPVIPAYGDSTIDTPNLDRLFNEGVRYTRMFSVSGVCAPSRFSIATGIYTTRGGAQHMRTSSRPEYMQQIGVIPYEATPNSPVRMMSEIMREHRYFTTNNSKQDYQFKAPVTAWDENSPQAHWTHRPANTPFFSVINIGITHESQIWARSDDSLLVPDDLDVPIPPYLPDTDLVRNDIHRMYSNISLLDIRVGAILDELEAQNLLEKTVIMFYSDHGGPLPRQKRAIYDSGLHVPFAIRFPEKQLAGMTDGQLISFVDLAPTVLSLAGILIPDFIDGQAFLGPQRATTPRNFIHAASDRFDTEYDAKRAVRDHQFKYIRNLMPNRGYYLAVSYREQMATMQELLRLHDRGGLDEFQSQWFRESKPQEELFNTEADPHELFNLADDPSYREHLIKMRSELEQWMQETNDPGTMDEMQFVERMWPNHIQPITSPVTPDVKTQVKVTPSNDSPLVYEIHHDSELSDSLVIHLSSVTKGASIGYQILSPDQLIGDQWQIYSTSMRLPSDHILKAIAHRIGYAPSDTVTITHQIN